jgi:hypothetical protein
MQNQEQSIQSNTQSKATNSSQVEQREKLAEPARTEQQPKRVKSLKNAPLTPNSQQTLPACLLQTFSNIATLLQLEEAELALWLEDYVHLPPRVLLHFLHQIRKYRLDPLSDEIMLFKNPEGQYQTLITIDGWMRLINQDPQFAGMTFKESSELELGIPLWMECSIYRHDRILPITVKEYSAEIKTEHLLWKTMPRRMLRHRSIQQCARLAFGIHIADQPSNLEKVSTSYNVASSPKGNPIVAYPIRTKWLKEQLKMQGE